jgi:deuterolysin
MPTFPAVFLILVLLAFVSANPLQPHGLTVSIAGPTAVTTIADLELTAHVTNTGPQSVKILKYSTILDDLPTRSFAVSKDNMDVEFLSIKTCEISWVMAV